MRTAVRLPLALAQAARDLSAALLISGDQAFERVLLERMIERAAGPGCKDPGIVAEAAAWRSVPHPGAIWGEIDTVGRIGAGCSR